MDFPYLSRVVKLNVAALAALASAPPPPAPVVEGAVSTDTTLSWRAVRGADAYVVRWRRTDSAQWEKSLRVAPGANLQSTEVARTERSGPTVYDSHKIVLPGVRVDDFVFGVSSVSKDGYESPVASAVPGGAFEPYTPPPPAS